MAEFEKVMKDRKRMCHETMCKNCPLNVSNNGKHEECCVFLKEYATEAEQIIEEWAYKNSVMTNEMKFKEVFGHIPVNKCYADISHRAKCDGDCDGCRYYAYAEYHAPEGREKE